MTRIGPNGSTSSLRPDFRADDLHDRGTRNLRDAIDNAGSHQHTPVDDERDYSRDDDFPFPNMLIACGIAAVVAFMVGFMCGRL